MIKKKEVIKEIGFLEESLKKVVSEAERLKKLVPEGAKLRAFRHGSGYQYYLRRRGFRSNGEYIKQKDLKNAVILAQIEYDERLTVLLKKTIGTLLNYKEAGADELFEEALCAMAQGKRELVRPIQISDQQYIIEWKEQEYESLTFREGAPEYYTRRGLRVRSKSEVIIADILDETDIPFLYEKPLHLKRGTVHPDFTILNVRERREIYWEHFGMMDDKEYRDNAFMKIREYEENDLYQYDSVIWTFETAKNPLNIREIRNMIKILKDRLLP